MSARTPTSETSIPLPSVLSDLNLPQVRDFAERLRFDPNEGRIWFDEGRIVMMRADSYGSLRDELIASLGMSTTRGLLTRLGYSAGCRDAELAAKVVGPNANFREILRAGAILHALQGYVLPDVANPATEESRDDFHGEWVWKNSLEDEAYVAMHGLSPVPVCWTEVGYSSGYLSTCVGKRILVREVECRAQGSSVCRNVAKPISAWDDPEEDLSFLEPQERSVRVYGGFKPEPEATLPSHKSFDCEGFIVGASTAFHVLRHKIYRVAPTTATVLLLGESGVGKSIIAREIHRCSSRSEQMFVEVNCAAIPEALIESELFGAERGAFSGASGSRPGRFEAADGGTLFLDEVGTLSMTAQGKLLRVLQNGEIERLGSNKTIQTNVRVVAATNEDLKTAVREGRFRQDLYFRLNVFPLMIQPLRERREDIPLLTEVLLTRFSKLHGRRVPGITHRAIQMLLHHSWPGNIRELENVLERSVILAQDDELIDLRHLTILDNSFNSGDWLAVTEEGSLTAHAGEPVPPGEKDISVEALAKSLLQQRKGSLAEIEDAFVRAALEETGGNITRAAGLLGITRAQMGYKVRKGEASAE